MTNTRDLARPSPSGLSDCIKSDKDINVLAGDVVRAVETQNRAPEICVAINADTMQDVREFRKREYRDIYPTMDLDNDVLDQQAITLFTRNTEGKINSTARLGVEGQHELPEHEFLQEYRAREARLMEWGRFIIMDGNTQLLKSYYETVYTLSTNLGFDAIVMAMRPNHIPLHKRLIGVHIVVPDTGVNYGGTCNLACVVWELKETKPQFFNWVWR